jgi:hypothetical protein
VKPCDVEELVCRIRRCLEKRGQMKMPASEGRYLEEER